MGRKKGENMNTKTMGMVISAMLIMVVCAGLTNVSANAPSVVISPDTIFGKGETQTVSGYDFTPNSTCRIDLLLPDASVVQGVVTANVNVNGSFQVTFVSPDKNGDGYLKAVDGDDVVSVLVHFEGTPYADEELLVSLAPNSLLAGQTSVITVTASFLEDANYVIDFAVTTPLNQDYTEFYVLHKGKLQFSYEFELEGYYFFNISVESTPYYYTQLLEVKENPNGDGGNPTTPQTGNISWEISHVGTDYTVQLWREGYGYITNGSIIVKYPDGSSSTSFVKNGVYEIKATAMGTYTLKYISQGKQYSTTFDYRITVSFTGTSFNSVSKTTLKLLVDGEYPTDSIDVNVSMQEEDYVIDTVTLDDGIGTYTATDVGDYVFEVNYMGITKTITKTYSDTYEVSEVNAVIQGNQIYVSGLVLGTKTQSAGDNVMVQVSVPSQGNYKQTVSTISDGSFEAIIDIVDKGSVFTGMDVTIKASIVSGMGSYTSISSYKSVTIKVSHDILGEYGAWILLLIVILIAVAYKTGFLSKMTRNKIHPPKKTMNIGGRPTTSSNPNMGW